MNEWYSVFFDKSIQYHKNISSLKSTYKFNTPPIKITVGFFFNQMTIDKQILKYIQEINK
jgi:hypothetical protein